jgi:hypothetical protein
VVGDVNVICVQCQCVDCDNTKEQLLQPQILRKLRIEKASMQKVQQFSESEINLQFNTQQRHKQHRAHIIAQISYQHRIIQ